MTPQSGFLDLVKVVAQVIAGIFIPLAIFIVGNRFTKQREKADAEQRHLAHIANLSESLASENRKKRLIALQLLGHLRRSNELPAELFTTVSAIAFSDDPEVAGAALVLIGGTETIPEFVVLLELLAPLKVHFDRTRSAFRDWSGFNEAIENEIMRSNKYIRDHLISKWYLIPPDLQEDARKLVFHYDAWLAEYDRLRPGGVRDMTEAFVFVGTKGKPFPGESERRFINRYDTFLAAQTRGERV